MKLLIFPGACIGPEIMAVPSAVLRRADTLFGLGLAYATSDIGLATLKTDGFYADRNMHQGIGAFMPHRPFGIRHCAHPPAEGDGGAQVERAADLRCIVPARGPRGRRGLPRRGAA